MGLLVSVWEERGEGIKGVGKWWNKWGRGYASLALGGMDAPEKGLVCTSLD